MDKMFSLYQKEAFQAFSFSHVMTLLICLLIVLVIFRYQEKFQELRAKAYIRYGLALFLLMLIFSLQVWYLYQGIWTIQSSLPLHLCEVALVLSIIMLFFKNKTIYEITYFWGLGGSLQALLTPDLDYAFPHLLFLIFFLSHAGIIIAAVWMSIIEKFRPSLSSLGKVFLITNIYALLIFVLNKLTGSNYLFLLEKPSHPSLIDHLGSWPWYILSLEILALIIFMLCYLPFLVKDLSFKKKMQNNKANFS